jgi:hypothetical protein
MSMFGRRSCVASVAPYKGGATLRYSATALAAVASATQCYRSATRYMGLFSAPQNNAEQGHVRSV